MAKIRSAVEQAASGKLSALRQEDFLKKSSFAQFQLFKLNLERDRNLLISFY